jgi:hypothetical protein
LPEESCSETLDQVNVKVLDKIKLWMCCRAKARLVAILVTIASVISTNAAERWWKGNLHTHSLWSDGDDYPEMIVDWYKQHGYQFLALSDHNVMLEGQKWINAQTNKGSAAALEKYSKRFGADWVERREVQGRGEVRLRTLEEFRGKFEEEGRFLLIPGEEISDHFGDAPIHLNASNLRKLIPPQGGKNVYEVMQNNINAVLEQRKSTHQPIIPHINHPNFRWAITAEDIMCLTGERFLEVYNGHPITWNAGDTNHPSHERIWDIVLTKRLAELGLEPIWGTAVDDAHNYHEFKTEHSNPGRGWIMVRSEDLNPTALIKAMEAGEFYASSGVLLEDVRRGKSELSIRIKAEEAVTYKTVFIGTRKGYDPTSEPLLVEGRPVAATRRYSKDIGAVLSEVAGANPAYKLKGDEIYVRAKIISSKPKVNPTTEGDFEMAWVQPVVTGVR